VSACYSDYFNSNRDQTKCNALHIFERGDLRVSLCSLSRSLQESRLQNKYGPSAGLDTHKLLQVPGR